MDFKFGKIDNILFIGSGQCGVTIAESLLNKYGEIISRQNKLFFNTNQDTKTPELVPLKLGDSFLGSGREIKIVMEKIIPPNKELIKKMVDLKLTPKINTVVLINSLGGASGSSINYHIVKEILLPYKETRDINIIVACILPSQAEGVPATSNSAFMISQYHNLSSKITIIPIENDKSYKQPKTGESTFYSTNQFILDTLYNVLDYEHFLGLPKENGYNTLDKQEYSRIMSPSDGFLIYCKVRDNEIEKLDSALSNFDLATAKKMVVLFRTVKGRSVTLDKIQLLDKMFPAVVKIVAESESEKDNTVEIIANGCDLPNSFAINVSMVVNRVVSLKEKKIQSKIKNKEALAQAKGNLLSL